VIGHALAPIFPPAARRLGIPCRLPGAGGVVVTFDDGPHPEGTPMVLETLARADAHAVFFLVGEQVRRRPELVARILAEGHQVALHGDRHRLQSRLPAATLRADLAAGLEAIQQAGGVRPLLHRPPYGIYSPAGLAAARQAGLSPLLWSRWGRDWRRHTTAEQIARRALRAIGPGEVILLHDADFYSAPGSHRRTAAALELVLAQLRQRKLATVLPVWQAV
jgi:peptidoglycan/xylan/chitin deacetylase (PgdA/CDA1 family)